MYLKNFASFITNKNKDDMADDPNKTHVDGWFVSNQPHEYDYFKTTIAKAFPANPIKK